MQLHQNQILVTIDVGKYIFKKHPMLVGTDCRNAQGVDDKNRNQDQNLR